MDTGLDLDFADGRYRFQLKLPQIIELQQKCSFRDRDGGVRPKGIIAIYASIMQGRGVTDDGLHIGSPFDGAAEIHEVYETIRLALIGGGQGHVDGAAIVVSALDGKALVERYIHPMPLEAAWAMAAAILHASMSGFEPKKKSAAKRSGPDGIDQGEVMASCAVMGVDWRTLGLTDFWALTEGWNAAHSTDSDKGEADPERLSRLMAAHSGKAH